MERGELMFLSKVNDPHHTLQATITLSKLAERAAMYDADGVDICFFNSNLVGQNMKVLHGKPLFQPCF